MKKDSDYSHSILVCACVCEQSIDNNHINEKLEIIIIIHFIQLYITIRYNQDDNNETVKQKFFSLSLSFVVFFCILYVHTRPNRTFDDRDTLIETSDKH